MEVIERRYVFLPKRIITGVESLKISPIKKNHCYRFLAGLIGKSYSENKQIDMMVDVPSTYLRKTYSSKYNEWLQHLVSENIISSNNHYSNILNQSKQYSINLNYTPPSYMWLLFDADAYEYKEFSCKKRQLTKAEQRVQNEFEKDVKKLKINYDSLEEIIENYVDSISASDFKIGEEIVSDRMEIFFMKKGIMKSVWMNRGTALKRSVEWDKELIQDGNRYYLMRINNFIKLKKQAVKIAYSDSLYRLQKKKYFANRNITNNRLDTNLTSMPNILTDKICKDNNLVKFDLSNAQFAIMSKIYEDKWFAGDFLEFSEKSQSGILYEYIQSELDLKTRSEAKTMMFELMFSSEKFNSPLKNKLKTLFPFVVSEVDRIKKEDGYKKFSVELQKKESEIFIDGLLKKIKSERMFCLTKHDCLIVKEKDAVKITEIIKGYFDKINFKGNIVME